MGRLKTTFPSAGFSEQIFNNREWIVWLGEDRPWDWSTLSWNSSFSWLLLAITWLPYKIYCLHILCQSQATLTEVPELGSPRWVPRQWYLVHSMEYTQNGPKSSPVDGKIFTEEHMEITLGRRGARAMTWPWMPGNHICSCFYQILEPKVRSVDLS